MRIEYLADHPALIPKLAGLHFAEWGCLHPEETLEARTAQLRACCGHGGIPTAMVALSGDTLCGSAMLVARDMGGTRPDLIPWLSGVYVVAAYRGKGYGTALVERVVAEAVALGVPKLYLYTLNTERMYARLGWSVLERCEYLGQSVVIMSKEL